MQQAFIMKCNGKYVCKSIIFNLLLVITVVFYVKPEVEKFMLKATYVVTKMEDVSQYQVPAIMICTGYKSSILTKYGLANASDLFLDKKIASESHAQLQTLADLYQELTYELIKDFNITVSGTLLKVGENIFNATKSLVLSQVPTFNHGTCLVLTMDHYLDIDQEFILDIHDAKKQLAKIEIFFLDEQDSKLIIKNLANDDHFKVQIDGSSLPSSVLVKLKETVQKNIVLPDLELFEGCLFEFIKASDIENPCQEKCIPILIKGLSLKDTSHLPLCQRQADHFCNLEHFLKIANNECTESPRFESRKFTGTQMFKDATNVTDGKQRIAMSFGAKSKKVEIEKLVYDLGTLIGTVGGSLGLFTGFSFYALFVDILDCVWP